MYAVYQEFLTASCLLILGMIAASVFVAAMYFGLRRLYGWARMSGHLHVFLAFIALAGMVLYGGGKPTPPTPDPDPIPAPEPIPDPDPDPDPDPVPDPDPIPYPTVESHLYSSVYGAMPFSACEYDGCVYDGTGKLVGVIQVKVGKPNASTRLASVKATMTVKGTKVSLALKGGGKAEIPSEDPAIIELVGKNVGSFVFAIGRFAMVGQSDDYKIDGGRNILASSDKDERNAAYRKLVDAGCSSVNMLWAEGNGSLLISNNGKAKISGVLADGRKMSVTSIVLVGESWYCVPVIVPKLGISFGLWMSKDGAEVDAEGIDGDFIAGPPKELANGAEFIIDGEDVLGSWSSIPGTLLVDYLPDGVKISRKGKKWALPKAGKLALKRGTSEVDSSKALDNPSALKLTYKDKDGTFKGSFKVYSLNNGRLKATTVNVSGIMIDDTGYGTAVIKNVGIVEISVGVREP